MYKLINYKKRNKKVKKKKKKIAYVVSFFYLVKLKSKKKREKERKKKKVGVGLKFLEKEYASTSFVILLLKGERERKSQPWHFELKIYINKNNQKVFFVNHNVIIEYAWLKKNSVDLPFIFVCFFVILEEKSFWRRSCDPFRSQQVT